MKALVFLIAALGIGLAHAQTAPAPATGSAPAASAQPQAKPAAKPAATGKVDAHRAEDIAKHQQMAQAHAEAARCLESGKAESACQDALRAACKGIAIGQYCGMRHGH